MPEMLEAHTIAATPCRIWNDVVAVCQKIPPLWDLKNYVAVNPFLGFTVQPMDEAARWIGDGLDAQVLPDLGFYRTRWSEGAFGRTELIAAARRAGADADGLAAILAGEVKMPRRVKETILTFAEAHDRGYGTDWNATVIRSAARWCAVHAAGGGKFWPLDAGGPGLFASWREAAASDRTLEIAGLRGFRQWASHIPARPADAISVMLGRLEVSPRDRRAYLYRLLGGLYGWASYFRREAWGRSDTEPGAVAELLAILISLDAAVAELASTPEGPAPAGHRQPQSAEDESVRLVFQEALEDGFVRSLRDKLCEPPGAVSGDRPRVQAVFCIDVRSEPLRRHLEAVFPGIETRGFAGFFGVALNWSSGDGGSDRCPVLLRPSIRLGPAGQPSEAWLGAALRRVQGAPAASFSFVEVLGLTYGLRLVGDSLLAGAQTAPAEAGEPLRLEPDETGLGISVETRVELAAGILKNMGFRHTFARLVLLCGHEGQSANNPHAAGLDCGACGGHGGALNARVAAALLNDRLVRARLIDRGWAVPEDTHFLPAVHNTTTDEVRLLDVDDLPRGHETDVEGLRAGLARACAGVRRERAPALDQVPATEGRLARWLRRRSRDWSEVRPEWGLARNAAFVAARRVRTRGADLQGRVFLHEYDAEADPDDSVLTLILTAPVVVASWINLQYFASTVDNRVFGAGDKTLHNRVGSLGVVVGNGGDLRTGLALQSVHAPDGSWFHEPLRLQVLVEAPTVKLGRVLAAQPGVKDLVDHGWIRLFALDPHANRLCRCLPGGGWEAVEERAD